MSYSLFVNDFFTILRRSLAGRISNAPTNASTPKKSKSKLDDLNHNFFTTHVEGEPNEKEQHPEKDDDMLHEFREDFIHPIERPLPISMLIFNGLEGKIVIPLSFNFLKRHFPALKIKMMFVELLNFGIFGRFVGRHIGGVCIQPLFSRSHRSQEKGVQCEFS